MKSASQIGKDLLLFLVLKLSLGLSQCLGFFHCFRSKRLMFPHTDNLSFDVGQKLFPLVKTSEMLR